MATFGPHSLWGPLRALFEANDVPLVVKRPPIPLKNSVAVNLQQHHNFLLVLYHTDVS